VKYSKNYPYAEDISYEDTVKALKMLLWGWVIYIKQWVEEEKNKFIL
jgi:hypothetical protein